MPHDVPSALEFPGLASLHRSFAKSPWQEKCDSAATANKALKTAKSGKAKKQIIHEHFSAWKEGCGSQIREFFPKYIELGLAYPDKVKSEIVKWAEDQTWIPLCGQCGVQRYGAPHPHRSDSVVWWLAVAIDEDFEVNLPERPRWCAPRWLAANLRETDRLIVDWSHLLSGRFFGVLDDAMDAARVKLAITTAPVSSLDMRPRDSSVTPPFTWKELEARFRDIQPRDKTQSLTADFTRTHWDSGVVSHEWYVGGNQASRNSFESLAKIAARKLGLLASENAVEEWLDRVRKWMEEEGLDKDSSMAWLPIGRTTEYGLTGTTAGLYSDKIAVISAMFCVYLMANGTPESANSPQSETTSTASTSESASEFRHSEDYCSIICRGKQYRLTPLAGDIVKVLHQAHKKNGSGLSGSEIRRKTKCGRIWDAFRSLDGEVFFSDLIEKVSRSVYRLNICERLPE